MGQYHAIVNLSKKTGFNPRAVGSSVHLTSIAGSGLPITSLIQLLSHEWKGDKVAIIGDYAENADLPGVAETFSVERLADVHHLVTTPGEHNCDALAVQRAPFAVEESVTQYGRHLHIRPVANYQRPNPLNDDEIVLHNVTKNEVITPEGFNKDPHRNKLLACYGVSTFLQAFTFLLAASCKGGTRGKGDTESTSPLIGSWAGDEIAVIAPEQVPADAIIRDTDMRRVLSGAPALASA